MESSALFLYRKLEDTPLQPMVLPVPEERATAAELDAWIGDYSAALLECAGVKSGNPSDASAESGAESASDEASDVASDAAVAPAKVYVSHTYLPGLWKLRLLDASRHRGMAKQSHVGGKQHLLCMYSRRRCGCTGKATRAQG